VKPTFLSLLLAALAGSGCVILPGTGGTTAVKVEAEVEVAEEAPPPAPVEPDDITEENARAKVQLLLEEIRRDERE
jgi:hypothetical protein